MKSMKRCSKFVDGECALGIYERPTPILCATSCEHFDGDREAALRIRSQIGRKRGCSGCSQKPQIVRWGGVRWFGTPIILRPFTARERRQAGCGCPVKTKAAWRALVMAWRYWRAA